MSMVWCPSQRLLTSHVDNRPVFHMLSKTVFYKEFAIGPVDPRSREPN